MKIQLFELAHLADLSCNARSVKVQVFSPAYQAQVFSTAAVAVEAFADGSSRHSEKIRSGGCHKCCSDCATLLASHPIPYRHLRHMTAVYYVIFSQASNIHSTRRMHIHEYKCK